VLQILDVIRAYLPAIVFVVLGIGLGVTFVTLNSVLGPKPKHARRSTAEPYESGLPSEVKKSMRFGISFYLVAMLFILFDIEAAFLYPWAVIYRDASRGNAGMFLFGEMLVFIVLLGVGYVYVWKKKAFDWK